MFVVVAWLATSAIAVVGSFAGSWAQEASGWVAGLQCHSWPWNPAWS